MFIRFIAWIQSFFAKPGLARYDLYHPGERAIYRYFDGKQVVENDPMILYKRVMDVYGDLATHLKVAASKSKDNQTEYNAAQEKLRKVFDVSTFKEGGLTEEELLDLFWHFWGYKNDVKKNSQTLQTSSEATSPTSEPTSSVEPASSNTSESGSTETVSLPEPLPPSLPESALPLGSSTPDSNIIEILATEKQKRS